MLYLFLLDDTENDSVFELPKGLKDSTGRYHTVRDFAKNIVKNTGARSSYVKKDWFRGIFSLSKPILAEVQTQLEEG